MLAMVLMAVPGSRMLGQGVDSALVRVSQLVATGDRSTARTLADSLLQVISAESPAYAEALYWHAFTAANAAEAERGYLRLTIEYPLAARAEDALLLLSQLEFARGDKAAALHHLDRLIRDYPTGKNIGRASFWTARIAMEMGDTSRACAALTQARAQLSAEDVETRNQADYYAARCLQPPATSDSSTAGRTLETPPTRQYSLQVAAYKTKREADVLARRLRTRGFDSRVTHDGTWYRVRIGRYASRADADKARERAKAHNVVAQVVEAEPK